MPRTCSSGRVDHGPSALNGPYPMEVISPAGCDAPLGRHRTHAPGYLEAALGRPQMVTWAFEPQSDIAWLLQKLSIPSHAKASQDESLAS